MFVDRPADQRHVITADVIVVIDECCEFATGLIQSAFRLAPIVSLQSSRK